MVTPPLRRNSAKVWQQVERLAVNNSSRLWRFAYYWLPLIAWAGVIFALSHTSGDTLDSTVEETAQFIPLEFLLSQEFAHMAQFGVLAALAYRLLASYQTLPRMWTLGGALLFAVCYGVTDEFHQMFVPGRSATLGDLALDTIGAALGLVGAVIAAWALRRLWDAFNQYRAPSAG